MKAILPLFAAALLSLGATAHKFYVSVTQIDHSTEAQSLQVTTRIFIDDLDDLLEERYGIEAALATEAERADAQAYIERYLLDRMAIRLDGEAAEIDYLGRRYDGDQIVCYLEVTDVDIAHHERVEVQNDVLMDLFEEQKNIVHLRVAGKKRSFVLIRENNKGMLNL